MTQKRKVEKVKKRTKKNIRKLKLSVYMSKPQKHFSDIMATPNSPIVSKRAQNDQKRQKLKKSQKTKNLSK